MAEWKIEFKDDSYFRLDKSDYYRHRSGAGYKIAGLRNIDYCYYTGNSLDFIECKEVNKPEGETLDCALKGVHSIAVVKTGLLENNKEFLKDINGLNIPDNIKINVYFVFNIEEKELEYQLPSMQPFIDDNIKCFSLLWNINEVLVMSYDQALKKLDYIKSDTANSSSQTVIET